jgi:hypothetical protein
MEYFKEVHIPNWATIQSYCISKWDGKFTTSVSFLNEELAYLGSLLESDVKQQLGLTVKIKSAIMFINDARFVQDLHIDGYTIERKNASNTALNLPILNCESGPMMWYSGDFYLTKSPSNTIKYLKINWTTEYKLAATKIINKPTLVCINIPHHIENQSDSPRLMLSVRFTPDIHIG